MNHAEYVQLPGVRWSELKSLRVSPLQYKHDIAVGREETIHLRIGRAVHTLLLEPERWDLDYVVWEGTRRGKAWERFAAQHSDRTILTLKEAERAQMAAAAVQSDPIAASYLHKGRNEHVLQWTDELTGVACKCRVDIVNGHLIELKTTHDVIPRKFAVHAQRLGYPTQLAYYQDGLRANGFELDQAPTLVVVQSDEPHDVVTYTVPDDVIEVGRHEYQKLLSQLRWCREHDQWPGVADGREQVLRLPAWAYADDEPEQPLTIGGVALEL